MKKDRIYLEDPNWIVKADPIRSKDLIIFIDSSNELKDSEGETILQEALIENADHFITVGVVSYDHLHKKKDSDYSLRYDPEYIIGEPIDVHFRNKPNNSTIVEAKLYGKNETARSLYNMISSGSTRVKGSIGGEVIERDPSDPTIITKVLWDEIALTIKPVNQDLRPSSLSIETFGKSYRPNKSNFMEIFKKTLIGVTQSKFESPQSLNNYMDYLGATSKEQQYIKEYLINHRKMLC